MIPNRSVRTDPDYRPSNVLRAVNRETGKQFSVYWEVCGV